MTIRRLQGLLFDRGCFPDQITLRKGVFTARWGFFYTNGKTQFDKRDEISKALGRNVIITGCGEVTKPFRGGASTAQSSHWWVTFTVNGGLR